MSKGRERAVFGSFSEKEHLELFFVFLDSAMCFSMLCNICFLMLVLVFSLILTKSPRYCGGITKAYVIFFYSISIN